MILRRLKNANVIPVVILDPKDFESKHFAFDLLKKAGRCLGQVAVRFHSLKWSMFATLSGFLGSYKDIIAVVNKCDEKMAEKGQWSNQQDWTDFWETANKKARGRIRKPG